MTSLRLDLEACPGPVRTTKRGGLGGAKRLRSVFSTLGNDSVELLMSCFDFGARVQPLSSADGNRGRQTWQTGNVVRVQADQF